MHHLAGDGDFRSAECIALLQQADIVVTNPPFSLFREYVAQLMEYEKKFLIIGNKNAITYKELFPLIKDNRLWVGNTPMSKDLLFDVPEDYAEELLATKKEGSTYKIVDGVVIRKIAKYLVHEPGAQEKARRFDSVQEIYARGIPQVRQLRRHQCR
ncbi:MAG: hypothetical protein OXF22_08495 [Anaerolineaceae bacterium]|nr:hypothetical protein [Anaerolineaceae bacterium]